LARHAYEVRIFCGGTLIGTKYAITAAHCTKYTIMHVVVGEHDQRINDGEENITLSGPPIVHPKYGLFERPFEHVYDIALLVLQKRVDNKFTKIALLPQPDENFENVDVTGWGYMKKGERSDVLRTVKLDLITSEDVVAGCAYTMFNITLRNGLLCGEDLQDISRGTCGGDSGGTIKDCFYDHVK
jgi:secreted trypsin-like serine protease